MRFWRRCGAAMNDDYGIGSLMRGLFWCGFVVAVLLCGLAWWLGPLVARYFAAHWH